MVQVFSKARLQSGNVILASDRNMLIIEIRHWLLLSFCEQACFFSSCCPALGKIYLDFTRSLGLSHVSMFSEPAFWPSSFLLPHLASLNLREWKRHYGVLKLCSGYRSRYKYTENMRSLWRWVVEAVKDGRCHQGIWRPFWICFFGLFFLVCESSSLSSGWFKVHLQAALVGRANLTSIDFSFIGKKLFLSAAGGVMLACPIRRWRKQGKTFPLPSFLILHIRTLT